MRRRRRPARRALLALGLGVVSMAAVGCGATGITAGKLAGSLAPTFSNLYVLQQREEGFPTVEPAQVQAVASCQQGLNLHGTGAGDNWTCNVSYVDQSVGRTVDVQYDVDLQTDGCYAASAGTPAIATTPLGTESVGDQAKTITPGGFPEQGPGSRQIPNPLWLINGCFSTT